MSGRAEYLEDMMTRIRDELFRLRLKCATELRFKVRKLVFISLPLPRLPPSMLFDSLNMSTLYYIALHRKKRVRKRCLILRQQLQHLLCLIEYINISRSHWLSTGTGFSSCSSCSTWWRWRRERWRRHTYRWSMSWCRNCALHISKGWWSSWRRSSSCRRSGLQINWRCRRRGRGTCV